MTSVFVSVLRMYLFTAIFCLMEIHVLRIIVNPQINYDLQTQLDNLGKLLSRQKLSLCFLEAFLHVKKLIELKFKSKDKNNTLRIDEVDNKKNPHKAGLRTRDSFFSVRQKFYFFLIVLFIHGLQKTFLMTSFVVYIRVVVECRKSCYFLFFRSLNDGFAFLCLIYLYIFWLK